MTSIIQLAWLAPIVMAWNQVKDVFLRLSSVLIERLEVEGQTADFLHDILWTEWKPIPLGVKTYFTFWASLRQSGGANSPYVFSTWKGATLFRKGRRVVLWQPDSSFGRLTCIRGTLNTRELVTTAAARLYDFNRQEVVEGQKQKGAGFWIEILQGKNVSADRRTGGQIADNGPAGKPGVDSTTPAYPSLGRLPPFKLYPMLGRAPEDFDPSPDLPPLQRYYMDPSLEVLVSEMQAWWSGRQWMAERGIAHRRGVLLEGPPGTGKSSLVKALAQHFQLPLVVVDLATFSDFDLADLRAAGRYPKVFLFEDIDRIFDGNRNIVEREVDKLSFDAFLNLLSGVNPLEGMIFLTSNHPEKLDDALIRPGRVDRRINVPMLGHAGRCALAHRILGDCGPEKVAEALEGQEDQPAANFENRCVQIALKWYWEAKLNNK